MDALEQIQGVPPGMYHRYGVLDDMDDDEDEEHVGDFSNSGSYNADMLVAGMAGLGVDDPSEAVQLPSTSGPGASGSGETEATAQEGGASISNWSLLAHPGEYLQIVFHVVVYLSTCIKFSTFPHASELNFRPIISQSVPMCCPSCTFHLASSLIGHTSTAIVLMKHALAPASGSGTMSTAASLGQGSVCVCTP